MLRKYNFMVDKDLESFYRLCRIKERIKIVTPYKIVDIKID